MGRKIVTLIMASALMCAGVVLFAGVPRATADKGGCPNDAAAKGAAHADANSAHGLAKQTIRGCSVAEPTPEPTPTPAPADQADVWVADVTVQAPDRALPAEDFLVRVSVGLLRDGPEGDVLVHTTFTFTAPPDCATSPSSPVVIVGTPVPNDARVSITRMWEVSCTQPGAHTFTADATVAIDPSEGVADPDISNNSGTGNDTTEIGS